MRFFVIPALSSEVAQDELNLFYRQHRIVSIEKEFVQDGQGSFWSLCVTFLESENGPIGSKGKPRVDYKEVLSVEDFAVFVRLRDLRKRLASESGVPAYGVFNNEQLAEMVQRRIQTLTDLASLDGVGQSRVDRFGPSFLDILSETFGNTVKSQ